MASVSLEADMVVDVEVQTLGAGILAGARPTAWNTSVSPAIPVRQSVTLNATALTAGSLLGMCQLNGQTVVKLVPVMIHEMLHGLGIGSYSQTGDVVGWGHFLDEGKTWYLGPAGSKAVEAYRAVVGASVGRISRIPVENSFGAGTAYSHWEEGLKDGFVAETRYWDDGAGAVAHPALPHEIMTGIAGSEFYITALTAGALADYGYPVVLESTAVVPYPRA
jgi:hypothetical protein